MRDLAFPHLAGYGQVIGVDFEKNRSAAIEAGATASTNEACKKGCKP